MGKKLAAAAFIVGGIIGCSSESPAANEPKAPRLVEAAKMAGSLHVTWVNEEPSCDSIEIERRTTVAAQVTADFTVLYRVPGAVDNKHDGSATEDAMYTYRLRCSKGGRYSPYSNELSASPK